jgi:hypothetical protein
MDDWELVDECRIWISEGQNLGPEYQHGFMVETRHEGIALLPRRDKFKHFVELAVHYVSLNMSQELPWLICV